MVLIHIYEQWLEFEREVTQLCEQNSNYKFKLGYGRRSRCYFGKFTDNINAYVYVTECLTDSLPYLNLVLRLRPLDFIQVIETVYTVTNSNSFST